MTGPVLFCGDPHGRFDQITQAVNATGASTVVLLGDLEPKRPLHLELAPVLGQAVNVWFVHGNHDADTDTNWRHVWASELGDRTVHCRVVELPTGLRLAGLGGVFRKSIWYPKAGAEETTGPAFRTRKEHAQATPRQDRWLSVHHHRKHFGSIYPEEVEQLSRQRADILVTHEAPGYHPHGFELLDDLARSMGAKVVVHGHQHDSIDSASRWGEQGFRSFGVGLRGVTAIDIEGNAQVVVPGEAASASGREPTA